VSLLSPADLEDIRRRNNCADFAARYVALRPHGTGFVGPCPMHSPDRQARDSTRFQCDAEGWVCVECGGGDVIKLCALVNGLDPQKDFRKAIEMLPDSKPRPLSDTERAELEREAAERERQASTEQNEWREKARRRAWDMWNYGRTFPGSPGERYLALRLGGIEIPPLHLRFDPAARYYVDDRPEWRLVHTGPAILAQIQRGGKFIGCHRTFIDLDSPKGKARIVDPKTGLPLNAKTMHGGKKGGHIDLYGPKDPHTIVLGEGTEKVAAILAAMLAGGRDVSTTAFWSAGDLGNLGGKALAPVPHPTLKTDSGRLRRVPGPDPDLTEKAIEIPASATRLVLLGDSTSDPFSTACTLARARSRYAIEGRQVVAAMAPDGVDFDDLLREAV
jgi:hypothetical protein